MSFIWSKVIQQEQVEIILRLKSQPRVQLPFPVAQPVSSLHLCKGVGMRGGSL